MNGLKWINKTLLIMGLLLVGLTSCGGEKPKQVAEIAIQAEIDENFEQLYSLLTTKDKEALTLENFRSFYSIPTELKGALELIPEAKDIIKAEGFKETVTGETATVMFKLILPDTETMGKLSLSDLQSIAGIKWKNLSELPQEIQDKIVEDVKKNGIPKKEISKQIKLVREQDEWKVDINAQKQISENKKIKSIYHED